MLIFYSIESNGQEIQMIQLTENAAEKIKNLLSENSVPQQGGLRVFVKEGCCSGYSYGMALEETSSPEDNIAECHGVRVIVDPQSLSLLDGAQIDYKQEAHQEGFRISNPNATSHCGCGNSFNA